MKRLLTLCLVAFSLGVQAQYQLQNNGFENWETVTGNNITGEEPLYWNSFLTANPNASFYGTIAAVQLQKSDYTRPGSAGSHCAYIYARKVIFSTYAQGNMTTGCINGGSMTATDANGNYNFTNEAVEGQAMKFTGKPDAISVWVNNYTSKSNKTGKIAAYLHEKGYYQDPNTGNTGNLVKLVASATASPASNSSTSYDANNWVQVTIPFTYENNGTDRPYYALVSFATNSTAGQGAANDYMYIDDVEMIYYSELKSAAYNGTTLTFTDGAATVDAEYDESLLSLEKTGKGGTIETSYDEASGLLTITVNGDNISEDATNFHQYTIQFNVAEPEPQVVSSKTYSEDLYVTVNTEEGSETTERQVADVTVETLDNGNINFVLKNFYLDGLAVGNIAVNNIEVAKDGSFAFNDNIQIAAGDDPNENWSGPMLGNVPLDLQGRFIGEDKVIVYIFINLTEMMDEPYVVDVRLGYARATMAVDAEAQYGTFCAPFAVNVPAGVWAYTVSSVVDRVLTLDELAQTIPANTPVVLFAENGLETAELFGVAESGTPTAGLLTGVYEDTTVPVDSYVLQNISSMVGFYQVAAGQQPTIGANHCYLTVPALGVKAFYFSKDDATAIQTIDNSQQTTDGYIYNFAGQRISKMQRGINIINSKKILK